MLRVQCDPTHERPRQYPLLLVRRALQEPGQIRYIPPHRLSVHPRGIGRQWFEHIRIRQIVLPRFQRMEAWAPREIADLLGTILRGLPAGAVLTLGVGDRPPFVSRPMAGAPSDGEKVIELLLDGQQRLTALRRNLTDDYPDRKYFVDFPERADRRDGTEVLPVARWSRNGTRYPVWADSPPQCWSRGIVPMSALRPGMESEAGAAAWATAASAGDVQLELRLAKLLSRLRQQVARSNLPFLALPVGTPREVALDVFVELNSRMVRLSAFDIGVAQVEDETGEPLHNLVGSLKVSVPGLSAYADPDDLSLSAAALLQNQPPTETGYFALGLGKMVEQWPEIVKGEQRTVSTLEQERVLDAPRLPTTSVLAPLIALWAQAPEHGDPAGDALILLRKCLWRLFLTDRYKRAGGTAVLQDHRALRDVITSGPDQAAVPCFSEQQYPLPDAVALTQAAWPNRRATLARAVLAVALRGGAYDIADAQPVSRGALRHREYHHLFPMGHPKALAIAEALVNRALDCALITWHSNRTISAQDPLEYLRERASAATLGVHQIRHRLATHAVPFDLLVGNDYQRFLEGRAEQMVAAIAELCMGRAWAPLPAEPPTKTVWRSLGLSPAGRTCRSESGASSTWRTC